MTERFQKLYELIDNATSYDELRSSGLLPEPDSDDGYYFVSYCHKDYKPVVRDIIQLRNEGAKIWYDRGLESGKSWISEVKKKISSFYCKGVIFYISRNYLNSSSCVMELDLFLGLKSKSALFITLDDAISENGDNIKAALEAHGYDIDLPILTEGKLFNKHKKLTLDDSVQDKLLACKHFAVPELLEYTFVYGMKTIESNLTDFLFGRLAFVSGVVDKNVRRVEIPSYIIHLGKKYRVGGILGSAFVQCDMLEEVVVSDGWISIANNAFIRCPSLKRLVLSKPRHFLGNPIGSIGNVFDRCPNASVIFNGKINYNGTFKRRNDILVAKHTDKEIWSGECFTGCKRLTCAVLGRYDNFGNKMFSECNALTDVFIPKNNVTIIMKRSFDGCCILRSIDLPKKMRYIGEFSFRGCASLREVHIPAKVKGIERNAFDGCSSIETVMIDTRSMENYDDTPYKRSCLLDELFPSAKAFYLLHPPKGKSVFENEFIETVSDKPGYKKYIRRNNCEQRVDN